MKQEILNFIQRLPEYPDQIANYEMSPEQVIGSIIVLAVVPILMFVYICWENDITMGA